MGKKSRMSILKRQREVKKNEKAAHKRAKRHGVSLTPDYEPRPTITGDQLRGIEPMDAPETDAPAEESPTEEAEQ